jgi:hypothetical protein
MARPRRHTLFATLLAAVMLGACTSTRPPVPATSPTAPPAQLASASSTSPEDQAKQSAREVVQQYFTAIPRCLADPVHTPTTCFEDVAISIELDDLVNALNAAKQVQSKASGTIDVIWMVPIKVDLTNRVSVTPPTVPKVTYRLCVDFSNFNVLDKNGQSLVPATRTSRSSTDMTVVNYKFPDSSQWRVGYQTAQADPC